MCKFLSELLAAKEPLFSMSIKQLEEASGRKAIDVKLIAEITEKAHDRIKKLGLDHADTDGKELYQALLNKVHQDNNFVAEALGVKDPESVQEMIPRLVNRINSSDIPKDCWVMKKSVAKKMLAKMPPKRVMDLLGYRSLDSMLKRENLNEIYGALRFAQDSKWLNEFLELYKDLHPSDFEKRQIEIVRYSHEKWGDIAAHFIEKKMHNITHLKELGVICILPIKIERMKGLALKIMPLLAHYYNEIRLYSAFFKLKQVQPDFGEILVDTLIADTGKAAVMAGQHVHWRVIQRYFGKLGDEYHPEAFEPHVQPEDLHWRKAETVLFDIYPELEKFWGDMDYVGLMFDKKPVTFNMLDVAFSYANDIPYDERYFYHFREALWNEIFMRYMGQKSLEDQILKQLDNEMIAPELL
ncbi:hypothetical protein DYH10_02245 [Candidatus Saccharibacteria bacterium CPR2]|nr:hypothetical protein [Candidatus Saccharibacteria bacterium CPR2]